MTASTPQLQRLSTGSAEFDLILGGGLPVRSLNVIAGEPGSGKTLFALQALFSLARAGKKCVYFSTLSEPSLKLIQYMQQFSFFDEEMIGRELVFVDLGSAVRARDSDLALETIVSRVEQEEPVLVVIDSFKAMRDVLADAPSARTFVYDLAVHMASWGASTLFVGEYTDEEIAQFAEFAIADGILRFSTKREALTAVRMVEVLKLRGSESIPGRHFFEIGPSGPTFFPRVRAPETYENEPAQRGNPVSERVSTGTPHLDEMFGGGLPRASTTVLQGASGTGKTILALQFLLEGARNGEPGIYFTLEETPDQLRDLARGFGWDLAPLEERGLLSFHYFSPVELSTDAFLHRKRALVERLGAKRAVLDSLTSMALGVPSEQRFRELVYAMTKHFRAKGVTLILNMEVAELLGSAQLSGHGISFAADNLVQLKYVELDGKLERGLSVLKARGIRHTSDVRRISITDKGFTVGSPFEGLRGVLTGLPVPVEAKIR
jgi:circadian clock protein KaiC